MKLRGLEKCEPEIHTLSDGWFGLLIRKTETQTSSHCFRVHSTTII